MSTNVVQFTIKGVDQASHAFKSVGTSAAGAARTMVNKFRGVQSAVISLTGAIVALGGALLAKSFINAASTSEQLRVRLTVLFGSVAEGNKVFKQMSQFASEVPFEFEQIMESATTLAGVVTGGADEIMEFMPLIADLAATSGLTLEETTGQVVRMFSAGAGAADLFRERGILAMLGFEAGVAISADKTKRRLIEAWESPTSRFRGATELLATTWVGLLSMMSDKWFQFRNQVMDSGLFDFLKAFATVVNDEMGFALENNAERATAWANAIINGIRGALKAVGVFMDGFRGIQFIWIALQLGWAAFKFGYLVALTAMQRAWHDFTEAIPKVWDATTTMINIAWENVKLIFLRAAHAMTVGWEATINAILQGYNFLVNSSPWLADKLGIEEAALVSFSETSKRAIDDTVANINGLVEAYKQRSSEEGSVFQPNLQGLADAHASIETIKEELEALSLLEMPSETIEAFMENVETKFAELREKTKADMQATMDEIKELGIESATTFNEAMLDLLETFFATKGTFIEQFADEMFKTMINTTKLIGKGVASIIVDGKKASEVFKNIFKTIAKQVISAYITLKIQRFISAKANIGATGAAAMASMSQAPWPLSLAAPAIAATYAGIAAGYAGAAAAHGGLDLVPNETTMLVTGGERIVSPKQNRDLTTFLDQQSQDAGGIVIENISIIVNTTATTFADIEEDELEEFVGGPLLKTLDKLDASGVRLASLERD